jgi:ribosomal protein S18 acetylase RimI-like enzyme
LTDPAPLVEGAEPDRTARQTGAGKDAFASCLIRPARGDNLAATRALLVETWHDTYDAILGEARVTRITNDWHSLANLDREFRGKAHAFLVGVIDGTIEGTASATLGADGVLSLGRLYVRPARQRQGLGGALLDACLAQFPGVSRIRLEVEAENARARAFYARHGFVETPLRGDCGGACDAVVYEKAVEPRQGATGTCLMVRPARDVDAQDLFGLMTLCFAEYPGCYVDPHADLTDLRAPATAIAERGGQFWVVEDASGRVGACASLDVESPGRAELHRVYVRPDLRRRGLAEMLVGLAEDQARAQGASLMFFWSDTRFIEAHRFYRRLGYRATGEERTLADISGSREYRFEKGL